MKQAYAWQSASDMGSQNQSAGCGTAAIIFEGSPPKPSHPMTAALQIEAQVYRQRLPEMLAAHEGEYVVLRGNDAGRFFPSFDAALEWAYDRFGLGGAFVKRVAEDQAAAHFSRDLG
jgi:hypothetical protein